MKDWRKDYVICPHVTQENKGLRHRMFRVCCEDCFTRGFLWDDTEIEYVQKHPLSIAKIKMEDV